MQASKLKQHVEFEETLDLGPFMRKKIQPLPPQPQQLYELCGVVVHDGSSVRSGHYYRQVMRSALSDTVCSSVVVVSLSVVIHFCSYVRNSNGMW
jgi:hypothetical protein